MEPNQLREMSLEELNQKLGELKEEVFHLKLKRATSRLDSPMKLRSAKRDLARLLTVLREKRLQERKG